MKTRFFGQIAGAVVGAALFASLPAQAQDIRVGLLGGITGPIAAMAPPMIDAARLAINQVNAAGGILNGRRIDVVVGDDGCNPQAATDAATKAVNIDRVVAVVGPHCSGALIAAVNSVMIPAGVLTVSPSATSPAITRLEDRDLVFRTVPSDDYQGRALARTVKARGISNVAVTYLNNDYGKGLGESFKAEFESIGGKVAAYSGHEEGKASYRSELAQLARSGADTLVIFDYGDGTGLTILRQALENRMFKNYIGADGMKSDAIVKALGADNLKTFFVSAPVGEAGASKQAFDQAFSAAGGRPDAIFVGNAYDAAFLVALALEHAKGDRTKLSASLRAVSSAPGEPILPGEWAKAKQLLAQGRDINYKGVTGDHEFDKNGDVPGSYGFFAVKGSSFESIAAMQ